MNFLTRAEINLSSLKNNLDIIRTLSLGKEVLAVVKADGYGHGIDVVVPCLYKNGVRSFAVSSVLEGEEILDKVEDSDVLILGITPEPFIERVVMNNHIQTIATIEQARALSQLCRRLHKDLRCHIKVNTGMNRLGIQTLDELSEIVNLPRIKAEGVFTHFANADSVLPEDRVFTFNQQSKFVEFARKYKLKCHSQNSAGIINHSEFSGDMVRAGISLYGYGFDPSLGLKPIMELKTTVSQIREVSANSPVSYGGTYITPTSKRLAVIPIGYADGYSRLNSNRGKVLINGKYARVCGRVCMDYTIVDVTDIDGVSLDSEVMIYSSDTENYKDITIDHISEIIGTIPYEITCNVSARVPRIIV